MAKVGFRNKTKFKLCKELVILVCLLVAMIATTICLSIPSKNEKMLNEFNEAISLYNTTNSTSFGTLTEETTIEKTSLKGIEKTLKASASSSEDSYTYVIYGTLTDAKICQFLSVIDAEAQNREVEKVYFYDASKVESQEDKEDENFLAEIENDEEVFNADVLEGVEEVDLLKFPAFFVYKNGELIFNSNTVDEETSYNWYLMINRAFAL